MMPEQFAGVSMMVWLACVYALGLVAVGWGFGFPPESPPHRFVAGGLSVFLRGSEL